MGESEKNKIKEWIIALFSFAHFGLNACDAFNKLPRVRIIL